MRALRVVSPPGARPSFPRPPSAREEEPTMAASLLALVDKRYRRLNARYQQWWFRYGQVALRAGRPVPGLARLRAKMEPDHDIAAGIMIVAKDAERDRVHLWVG